MELHDLGGLFLFKEDFGLKGQKKILILWIYVLFSNCLQNIPFYFTGVIKTLPLFLPVLSTYSCLTLACLCNQPRMSATLKIFYYFGWRRGLCICSPAKLRGEFQEHVCLFWNFLTAEQFWRFESSKKNTKDKLPKSQETNLKT